MTRVLVTNDDGLDSPGIHALAQALERAGNDVLIVAPDHDASGTGTAVGDMVSRGPVPFTTAQLPGVSAPAYAVAATPALAVMIARFGAFGPAPEVVVSGINSGLNTGRGIMHSGTVGAALSAQNFGARAMAVSVDRHNGDWRFDAAAEMAARMLPHVIDGPSRCALNLNVPGGPVEAIRGVRWGRLAASGGRRSTCRQVDGALKFEWLPSDYEPAEDTDLGLVRAGYAAITAVHGAVEVWGESGLAGEAFAPAHGIPSAFAGAATRIADEGAA